MLVHLKALSAAYRVVFERTISLDPRSLVEEARIREGTAREKGRAFIEGTVCFFATELLNLARGDPSGEELLHAGISAAMAAWLVDSLFAGVSEGAFVRSDLYFTLFADGRVKYDRLPKLP